MSSQEDITLVDLHMQVNKPIIDSPLLMASYVTHLAQVRCNNWSSCCMPFGADVFSTPLFQQNEDGVLVYIGCRFSPHFNTYSNWREVRIVSRETSTSSSTHNVSSIAQSVPRSHPWDPNVIIRSVDNVKHSDREYSLGLCEGTTSKPFHPFADDDNEFMTSQSDTATRNSIVIRFKGQVEITLTPLLLEGLQR